MAAPPGPHERDSEEVPKELHVGAETLARTARMARFNAWTADMLRPFVSGEVIELGAGVGNMTALLVDQASRYLAVDNEPSYLVALNERFGGRPGFATMRCDIQSPQLLAAGRSGFDTVVCLNVLEHVEHDADVLAQAYDLLRPGGRAVLWVPALPWLYGSLDRNLDHYRRYGRRALRAMLTESGWQVTVAKYFNLFGVPGWFLNGRVLRRRILPTGALLLYDALVPVFSRVERWSGPPVGQSLLVVALRP